MPALRSELLNRYLQRIAYEGEAPATLATLQKLLALHTASLPFENFSPLLGEPVSLQLPALQAKLLDSPRGGWCFEHNTPVVLGVAATGLCSLAIGSPCVVAANPRPAPGSQSHAVTGAFA